MTQPNEQVRTSSPPARWVGTGSVREVLDLAYPVILTQVSVTLMGLVDSAMVGRLGASELGAVGFGGIWMWTVLSLFVGLSTSVQTFVAQEHGAGRARATGQWVWQGLYAVVPLTGLAMLAIFWAGPMLIDWIEPSEALEPLAADYIQARSLGGVGLVSAMVLTSFFRGLGDTRTPLYCTVVANLFNAVLDYGLIFGELGLPEWGVYGAGFATSLSEWILLLTIACFFLQRRIRANFETQLIAIDEAAIRRLLRIGLPIGGQWCLEMTSFAAFSAIVVRMGDSAMATSQAIIILLSVSFMQAVGLSIAVATLVGRYIGSGDLRAAEKSFYSGIRLALMLGGVIAIAFLAFPEALVRIFTSDSEILQLGGPLVMLGAAFQIFDALGIVSDGALRGAGDTLWPFAVRFALAWGVQVPIAYTLGVTLDGGLLGAWLGAFVYIVLLASILVARFRSGRWRAIQI